MSLFWFIVAVLFFVLWLRQKSDDTYLQGFQDGYRDLSDKIRDELNRYKTVRKKRIETLLVDSTVVAVPVRGHEDELIEFVKDEQQHEEAREVSRPAGVSQSQPLRKKLTPKQKEARSLRNLNILLFMGSLLLVAAGAAFVATAMPDIIKLLGIWILVAGFYTTGIILRDSPKLHPAAVAFLGTGLSLLPFVGVAMYEYAHIPASTAWMMTSLVGIVMYFYAAIVLHSQVVSYLTLGFVLSLAASTSGVWSAPLVFSFVAIILVALLFTVIAYARPTWVPAIFTTPIEQAGQIVTPVALASSLILFDRFSLWSYEVLFAVASLHYFVAWLQSRRYILQIVARWLLHLALFVVAYDVLHAREYGVEMFTLAWLSLTVVHMGVSLYQLSRYRRVVDRARNETMTYWLLTTLQLVALSFVLGSSWIQELSTLIFGVVGVGSLIATLITRKVRFAITGLVMSVCMPMTALGGVLHLAGEWALGWFVVASLGAAAGYLLLRKRHRSKYVRIYMITATILYWLMAVLLSMMLEAWLLTVLLWVGVGLFYALSYLERRAVLIAMVTAISLMALASIRLWWHVDPDTTWSVLGGLLSTAIIAYLLSCVHAHVGDTQRRIVSVVMVVGLLAVSSRVGASMDNGWRITGIVMLLLATIQSLYSLVVLARLPRAQRMSSREHVWFTAAIIFQLIACRYWFGDSYQAELTLTGLSIATALLLVGTVVMRSVVYAYGALMLSLLLPMLLFGAVMKWPGTIASVVCFVLGSVSAFSIRVLWAQKSKALEQFVTVSYVSYYIFALLVSLLDTTGQWQWMSTLLFMAGALLFYAASYVERTAALTVMAWVLIVPGVWRLLPATLSPMWHILYAFTVVAMIAYCLYAIHYRLKDTARRMITLAVVWIALVWALTASLIAPGATNWTPLLLLAWSLTIAVEGMLQRSRLMLEVAIYGATLGAQRLVGLTFGEMDVIVYAYWWALAVAVTASWRSYTTARLIIAMGIVTGVTALEALGEGGWYSILFLVEHIVLLVVGVFRNKRWALWWGLVASSLAVLYFLRDITFLAFAFLGILLIGIVVWRLNKAKAIPVKGKVTR